VPPPCRKLLNRLRTWRSDRAKDACVPAYRIALDRDLLVLAMLAAADPLAMALAEGLLAGNEASACAFADLAQEATIAPRAGAALARGLWLSRK
jgi:hypothetical protein